MVIALVFFLWLFDGMRYWYDPTNSGGNSAVRWMRRLDNSAALTSVIWFLILAGSEWLLLGVARSTRNV